MEDEEGFGLGFEAEDEFTREAVEPWETTGAAGAAGAPQLTEADMDAFRASDPFEGLGSTPRAERQVLEEPATPHGQAETAAPAPRPAGFDGTNEAYAP